MDVARGFNSPVQADETGYTPLPGSSTMGNPQQSRRRSAGGPSSRRVLNVPRCQPAPRAIGPQPHCLLPPRMWDPKATACPAAAGCQVLGPSGSLERPLATAASPSISTRQRAAGELRPSGSPAAPPGTISGLFTKTRCFPELPTVDMAGGPVAAAGGGGGSKGVGNGEGEDGEGGGVGSGEGEDGEGGGVGNGGEDGEGGGVGSGEGEDGEGGGVGNGEGEDEGGDDSEVGEAGGVGSGEGEDGEGGGVGNGEGEDEGGDDSEVGEAGGVGSGEGEDGEAGGVGSGEGEDGEAGGVGSGGVEVRVMKCCWWRCGDEDGW
ncbi:hypothetical protein P4O66_001707 [Electrophorus voltai]|uniref:Uncharacterized protein n=1 Tax=Electrophorus voltai TaxID=2609070 RepID=A0AAD9DVB9_9TELE|nr:hypothetical protein P4O66_001707 [Electrophorus voltai]